MTLTTGATIPSPSSAPATPTLEQQQQQQQPMPMSPAVTTAAKTSTSSASAQPSPVAGPATAGGQEIPDSVKAELDRLEQEHGGMAEVEEGVGELLGGLGDDDDDELLGNKIIIGIFFLHYIK